MTEVTNIGEIISAKITRIVSDLKAIPGYSPKDEHAAFCNCIEVMLGELKGAGHHVPPFLAISLIRLAQSAPEVPHPHTDKMFTVNAGDALPERDQSGFAERLKRTLPIALVNLLVMTGLTPAVAVHRVASACAIKPAKLRDMRKNATRKDNKADFVEQLEFAVGLVGREYSKLLNAKMGKVDARNLLITNMVAWMEGLSITTV